jgi:hypothetical protein
LQAKAKSLRRAPSFFIAVFLEKRMQIGTNGLERTKVELKYCECCGALWLRKQGGEESICVVCDELWSDLPGAWIDRVRNKPAVMSAGGRA